MVKIVGIGGSLRSESYTYQALKIVVQRLEALGAFVSILDLREMKLDRKSTRLNSSHQIISYAVFCLKKKNNTPL